MSFARLAATRGTCDRAKVGCVLVKDNRILATGYNGAPPGAPHCDDVGHLMVGGNCVRSAHAECSALFFSARHGVEIDGAQAFITHFPCIRCLIALMSAGVKKITYDSLYVNGISFDVFNVVKTYDEYGAVELADMAGNRLHQLNPTFDDQRKTLLKLEVQT